MAFLPAGAELLDPYPDLDAGLRALRGTAATVSATGLKRAVRAMLQGRGVEGYAVTAAVTAAGEVRVVAEGATPTGVHGALIALQRAPGAFRYAGTFQRQGDQWAELQAVRLPSGGSSWRTPVLVGCAAAAVLLVVTRKGTRR